MRVGQLRIIPEVRIDWFFILIQNQDFRFAYDFSYKIEVMAQQLIFDSSSDSQKGSIKSAINSQSQQTSSLYAEKNVISLMSKVHDKVQQITKDYHSNPRKYYIHSVDQNLRISLKHLQKAYQNACGQSEEQQIQYNSDDRLLDAVNDLANRTPSRQPQQRFEDYAARNMPIFFRNSSWESTRLLNDVQEEDQRFQRFYQQTYSLYFLKNIPN